MSLLDTTALSALRRPDHPDARVAAGADAIDPAARYLSAKTVLHVDSNVQPE